MTFGRRFGGGVLAMKLHADLSQRAIVQSDELDWVQSPLAGVERRMLERDGDEVARATSLVRYAPESFFDFHRHDKGEEFLVLDGVFSDEMGDFPAGMYVRNPPGSRHKPHSEVGAIIFVKLRQFADDDLAYVRLDTNSTPWQASTAKDVKRMVLHSHGPEQVVLLRFAPNAAYGNHRFAGGAELFVLDGVLEDEYGRYPKGTWLRNPPASGHQPFSTVGCTIYLKTGHLGMV